MKYMPIFLRVWIFVHICPSYTMDHKGIICIYIYIHITCCHIQSWIISVASLQFQCFNPQISSARKQTPKPKQKIASTLASPKDSLFQHQRSGSTPKEKSKKKSLNLFEISWKNQWIPWILSFLHPKSFQVAGRCTHQSQTSPICLQKRVRIDLYQLIYRTSNKAWQHIANESFPPLAESRCHQPTKAPHDLLHVIQGQNLSFSQSRLWGLEDGGLGDDHQFHRVCHNPYHPCMVNCDPKKLVKSHDSHGK